jgi:Fur family transcriptional regulator, ferric uptake regulator
MNAPLERLKAAGYKLTKARQVVLSAIEQAGGHVTSTDVLERVGGLDNNIGRASVFRTLDLFTRLSIIRPTYIGTSMTPYYVLMPEGHHHHIICIICNRVIEFEDCGLEAMAAVLENRLNVKLTGHLLEFYGRCDQCINKPLMDEDD